MANQYSREKDGQRFTPGGMNTVKSVDQLGQNEYAYLQNVRAYLRDRLTGRGTQSTAIATAAAAPHSIRRMNDSTPSGPVAKYVLVIGAAGAMYVNSTSVATGFSGNPVSLCPFRPNASVQPWMYVGDSDKMVKIRSDGLTYKTGIAEPQSPPVVGVQTTVVTQYVRLPANTPPWTNIGGQNPAYNYSGTDGQPPYPTIIPTPVAGSTVVLTVTGTATVNGAVHAPGDAGSTSVNFPGDFITTPAIVVGCFTDANGNIIALSSGGTPPPVVVSIGAGVTLTVPIGAVQLQVGINSEGGTFSANSGYFTIQYTVSTSAVTTNVSSVGNYTAYIWGDSPHSGSVASYIWKNPNDSGSGTSRSSGTASATASTNSLILDSTPEDGTVPVNWSTLNSAGATVGTIPLFTPALESEGYQDFNCCIVGSIYVPQPGTYTFQIKYKDQAMMGIGGGATVSGSFATGPMGQTVSVVDGLPLVFVGAADGGGAAHTDTVSVTFPSLGVYSIELDWDYWYHSGRSLIVQCSPTPGAAVALIPPLPYGVRNNVSYGYKYRSSATGAQSNPGQLSTPQLTPVLANTITSEYSTDPQVDKVDYYRQDTGLPNYTYVITGPNDGLGGTVNGIVYNTPVVDEVSDLAAASNQQMQIDDFEPFPSIDTPKSGMVTIIDGVIEWVSGDKFNTRWLPGTEILIGSPTQNAYTLVARPTSTTTMVIPTVPDTIGDITGLGVPYNIAEPILANQPLPSLWGPTDNSAYMFGCGDPNRPGTLYYTKGNNPDSAPDTNQIEVTSPSEPLMNGVIVNGIGMVFSTERAWLIYPTFTTALATVSGVAGQAFNLIESITNRGLYIRAALCTEAGKNVFFRGKDGIYVSPGGAGSSSITDAQIYNLFTHEGVVPSAVTIGTYTVYPPDDTKPEAQKLSFAVGYLYYDYQDVNGNPRTLVYDVAAKGWSVDVYGEVVACHADAEGQVNETYVGCTDFTVRSLAGGATETATSIVATAAINGGDARAFKRVGDNFVKALIVASNPLAVALYSNRYASALSGYSPTSLTGAGTLQPYILDFTSGIPQDVIDLEAILSWNTDSGNYIDLWQPNFLPLPESIQGQASDWDDCGIPGNKFIQGLLLELNTYNVPKTFLVQRSDDGNAQAPVECPVTVNGQTILPFTFNPPFLAHMVRRIATDGVPWQAGPSGGWRIQWIVEPYPESSTAWITEGTANGQLGYQHIYQVNLAYISTQPVTLTMTTDQGVFTMTFPATGTPSLLPAKILQKAPRNKWKTISYAVTCSVPFYLWRDLTEVWVKPWGSSGEYEKIKPFGGASALQGAQV